MILYSNDSAMNRRTLADCYFLGWVSVTAGMFKISAWVQELHAKNKATVLTCILLAHTVCKFQLTKPNCKTRLTLFTFLYSVVSNSRNHHQTTIHISVYHYQNLCYFITFNLTPCFIH